ncbi:HAD hydrolase family protein [Curvibacter sp. CHRR-16]|uniref:KdsC family phosphatase n=1 Tax=Curvibacter sp. CHRR-16 TaxID=2835872 RepID=UPI001BD91C67|nr:HAD hydrolase family protein [Curvibacter sp. CHRR-16]MBT0570331.1 HAD hydrolase family protein [Curvibacter sp. CHRR-16]
MPQHFNQRFSPAVLQRAASVRVFFFDIDGVFTDGGLLFTETGETIKRFNTLDGHGIKLLQQGGVVPVVITGRDSAPLRKRLSALGVEHAYFGTEDKGPAATDALQRLQLEWSQAAAMGDDWPDLPVMRRVALACAPANAHPEVQAVAHYSTQAMGGHGAVREACDLVLQAVGAYDRLLGAYQQ